MPTEKFANEFVTSLSSGIDASDTSISLAAVAPVALRAGQARLRIGDELLLAVITVDGVSPHAATRAVEGTVAAVHASGAAVTHVLTAAVVTDHETRLGAVESGEFWAGLQEGYVLTIVGGVPRWAVGGAAPVTDGVMTTEAGDFLSTEPGDLLLMEA